jgi:hypothetical protein
VDWRTFAAEVIKALAWPLTVLGLFVALRRPLLGLLPLVTRLRYKDLEFDFARRLEEASVEAAALAAGAAARGAPAAPAPAVPRARRAQARTSPRAAVLEAWIRLEAAALEAARRRGAPEPVAQLRAPTRLIEALEEHGVINARQAAVFHDLRNLRNSAAHALGFAPAPDTAADYVRLAARLEQSLAAGG